LNKGFFNGDVAITGTLVQPSDRKLKKEATSLLPIYYPSEFIKEFL
jgi:hypothetical protein